MTDQPVEAPTDEPDLSQVTSTDNGPKPEDGDQDLDQSPDSSYEDDGTPTVAT